MVDAVERMMLHVNAKRWFRMFGGRQMGKSTALLTLQERLCLYVSVQDVACPVAVPGDGPGAGAAGRVRATRYVGGTWRR
jgi:hypothetical protein